MTVDATPRERLEILRNSRTVALVGVSPNPLRSSNFVATYLTRTPYTVWPVNPNADEVLGKKSYPSLSELPDSAAGRWGILDRRARVSTLPFPVSGISSTWWMRAADRYAGLCRHLYRPRL